MLRARASSADTYVQYGARKLAVVAHNSVGHSKNTNRHEQQHLLGTSSGTTISISPPEAHTKRQTETENHMDKPQEHCEAAAQETNVNRLERERSVEQHKSE